MNKPTEAIRLLESLSSLSYNETHLQENAEFKQKEGKNLGEIPDCPSDKGMIDFLNLNKGYLNLNKVNKTWSVCAQIKYTKTQSGSINQYKNIILNKAIKVWLFSGDWDDVVPYPDTEKNLEQLKVQKSGDYSPWFVGEHHAGFYQAYSGNLTVITVKGASHMVPQTKPKASYQMFFNFINNRPINTPVDM